MNRKKIIKGLIKSFKKELKKGTLSYERGCSKWDIHRREYSPEEIAARFLRRKGYDVDIEIDNSTRPVWIFGYIRFFRHCLITFNKNICGE